MAEGRRKGASGRGWRVAVAGALVALPLVTVLLEVPPGAFSACGTYGYVCTQSACFSVQISTDQGYSWRRGSVWIYGRTGMYADLYVRTTLSLNVSGVEGWSLGVRHSAPSLVPGVNGGSFVLRGVVTGPGVGTVKAGGPADFESTRQWTCGFTQGVVVDMGGTGVTAGACTDREVATACYRVTFPTGTSAHTVTLDLTPDVGDPAIANTVVKGGQSLSPCLEKLTLYVYPSKYNPTPSYCPLSAGQPEACPEGGEGALAGGGAVAEGGAGEPVMFIRGDANVVPDGSVDISDGISILGWLFLGRLRLPAWRQWTRMTAARWRSPTGSTS